MATLSEHATNIKAAIQAAVEDGYRIEVDVDTVFYDGTVERVEVDIFDDNQYENLLTWDFT